MSNGIGEIICGYIFLILSVLSLIIFLKGVLGDDAEEEWVGIHFIITHFFTMMTVLFLVLGYNDKKTYYDAYETVLYEKIESVDRGSEVEGHFSLFGGHIDTKTYYYFYVNTDYGYELKQVAATETKRIYLVEDDTQTPHVKEKKEVGNYAYIQIVVPTETVVKEYKA